MVKLHVVAAEVVVVIAQDLMILQGLEKLRRRQGFDLFQLADVGTKTGPPHEVLILKLIGAHAKTGSWFVTGKTPVCLSGRVI